MAMTRETGKGMATNADRLRTELDELEGELVELTTPFQKGLDHWGHRMKTLIHEIQPSLSNRFALLRWHSRGATGLIVLAPYRQKVGHLITNLWFPHSASFRFFRVWWDGPGQSGQMGPAAPHSPMAALF
jgi:hypothetical protein